MRKVRPLRQTFPENVSDPFPHHRRKKKKVKPKKHPQTQIDLRMSEICNYSIQIPGHSVARSNASRTRMTSSVCAGSTGGSPLS